MSMYVKVWYDEKHPTAAKSKPFIKASCANRFWLQQVMSCRRAEAINKDGIVIMKTENGKVFKNVMI